ncbi:CD209 antigen-like protein E [Megalops cyprinoides]|uniref:CD209 antigen-like protein E n=1 Tax=Megalops cyprinoides TaxID=118141 RepID=UPI00186473AE|nr:CD209 antigen-like protein E [Megalops cyprinoides]
MEMCENIYANEESVMACKSKTTADQNPKSSPGDQHLGKRLYRVIAVCLGLLCVLLLTAITVLCIHYKGVVNERDQLETSNTNLKPERDQLKSNYTILIAQRDQIKSEKNRLQRWLEHTYSHGYITFDSKFYYVSNETKTWIDSQQDCRERGAHLVIINSREEQEFISGLKKNVWIGLNDRETEGTWKWVDGTTLTTEYWQSGQPSNGGITDEKDPDTGEDCAENAIFQYWRNGKSEDCADCQRGWNDVPCSTRLK